MERPPGRHLPAARRWSGGRRIARLFTAVARAVLARRSRRLSEQLERPAPAPTALDLPFLQRIVASDGLARHRRLPPLTMANGIGGFTADGREYVVVLDRRRGHAAAMVQRPRQSASSAPSSRLWRRVHLVGQQPREPADARSRMTRSPIRRRRPSSCATRKAARCGAPRRARCRVATDATLACTPSAPASRVRTRPGASCASGSRSSCSIDEPVKASLLTLTNTSRRSRGASASSATTNGCSARPAWRHQRHRGHQPRRGHRGAHRTAIRYNTEFADRVAFCVGQRTACDR